MPRMFPTDRDRDRSRVFALALALRIVAFAALTVALSLTNREVFLPDERIYLVDAERVAEGAPRNPELSFEYSYVLGLLFRFTGEIPWLPRLLNVFLGAVLAVIVYEIVRALSGRKTARVAGLAVALWPSLILWSTLVLKDSLLFVALGLMALGVVWSFQGRWPGVGTGIGAGALVLVLRPWTFFVASAALAVPTAVEALKVRSRRILVIVVLLVGIGSIGSVTGAGFLGGIYIADKLNLYEVGWRRSVSAEGSTAFTEPPKTSTDVIEGIPEGVAVSLFGPLPWQTDDPGARALLLLELPLWYLALFLAALALWRLGRAALMSYGLFTLLLFAGLVLVMSIYQSNGGTLFRLRAMVIPIVLSLAAETIVDRRDRSLTVPG